MSLELHWTCETLRARTGGGGSPRLCHAESASGEQHPFYRWMWNGAELYRLLTSHHRLFEGQHSTSSPLCFETFPHAVASALAGKILPAKQKRTDRPRLLREVGLSRYHLSNIDMVDATLCALTAHHLLAGTFKTYGDVQEGFIVVPKSKGW